MAVLRVFLWALTIAVIAADDSCPPPEDISPCTCDGEGLNCMGARTPEEIKRAFNAKFKYGGVRSVWVQGTPISDIPADIFGNVRSQQYYVEVNNVTSLNFNAFRASKKTMKTLSLFGNKLDKLDYSPLEQYERLELLNLGRNQITSIPDNAFTSKSLYTVVFAQNKISHIGSNAFANCPNLGKIELSMNQLTALNTMALAMKSHPANLLINLAANKISDISATAFQGTSPQGLYLSSNQLQSLPSEPFSNLVTRIAQKGGFIDVTSNPLTCEGCDYSWIVLNKDILKDRLIGFTCRDGRRITELTKPGIKCNK